jgi:hypothetical protein
VEGSDIKRIREALGQATVERCHSSTSGVMLGLYLAVVKVSKWEDERTSGQEAGLGRHRFSSGRLYIK